MITLLLCGALISATGCSSGGVPQEEYDKVVQELDELKAERETESNTQENQQDTSVVSNGLDSMYLSDMPDTEENILKNINILTQETIEGDVVVFLTNNNTYAIPDIELQIVYYQDGDIINTDEDGHDVLVPGNTVVSKMDAPDNYDDFEVIPTVEWDNNYKNWIYNLNVSSNFGDDGNVILQIENIGNVDIEEVEYIVVFYSGEQIVNTSFAQDIRDLKAGDKAVENVDIYDAEFDSYTVYINQAHTFFDTNNDATTISDSIPSGIGVKNSK